MGSNQTNLLKDASVNTQVVKSYLMNANTRYSEVFQDEEHKGSKNSMQSTYVTEKHLNVSPKMHFKGDEGEDAPANKITKCEIRNNDSSLYLKSKSNIENENARPAKKSFLQELIPSEEPVIDVTLKSKNSIFESPFNLPPRIGNPNDPAKSINRNFNHFTEKESELFVPHYLGRKSNNLNDKTLTFSNYKIGLDESKYEKERMENLLR